MTTSEKIQNLKAQQDSIQEQIWDIIKPNLPTFLEIFDLKGQFYSWSSTRPEYYQIDKVEEDGVSIDGTDDWFIIEWSMLDDPQEALETAKLENADRKARIAAQREKERQNTIARLKGMLADDGLTLIITEPTKENNE